MKIHLEKIINPRFETNEGVTNRDVIGGNLIQGYRVRVKRYLRGWTPHLRITVGSHVVHDTDATAIERTAFEDLARRVEEETESEKIFARNKESNAALRLFSED